MANVKVIAIVAALVIVVAGAGAAIVLTKGDSSKNDKIDATGRLMVLGNANNDDVIDNNDVTTLEDIIDTIEGGGSWDKTAYPYADANNDGSITAEDVDLTKKIIDKTVGRVNYVNCNDVVKSAHYPLNKYVAVGSYAINAVVILDSKQCVGVSGSAKNVDNLFWNGIKDIPKISNNSTKADYELTTNIPGVQAVVCTYHGVTNEDLFNQADIDVIRLDFNGVNELAAMMILGFLTGETEKYLAIADAYDAVYEKVKEVQEKHPEMKDLKALNVYNNNTIQSNEGEHGWHTERIGIPNVWVHDDATDGTKVYQKVAEGDPEWYLNARYVSDIIVQQFMFTYETDADPNESLEWLNTYFYKMAAFPDNTIVVNGSIPQHAFIAYMLEGLYPEDVGVGYGNSVLQSFLETFVPSLTDTGYDVSKDGVFLITKEQVKAYADAHPIA